MSMTTVQLREKLWNVKPVSYGHFQVTFTHRGKKYSAVTTNTQAIDAINGGDYSSYTEKEALQALRNEVLIANNLI